MCILEMWCKTKTEITHCPTKMKDYKAKALRCGWKSMGFLLVSCPYICHIHLLVWKLREGAAGLFPQAQATEPWLVCSPCKRRHSIAMVHSTRKRNENYGCRPTHTAHALLSCRMSSHYFLKHFHMACPITYHTDPDKKRHYPFSCD